MLSLCLLQGYRCYEMLGLSIASQKLKEFEPRSCDSLWPRNVGALFPALSIVQQKFIRCACLNAECRRKLNRPVRGSCFLPPEGIPCGATSDIWLIFVQTPLFNSYETHFLHSFCAVTVPRDETVGIANDTSLRVEGKQMHARSYLKTFSTQEMGHRATAVTYCLWCRLFICFPSNPSVPLTDMLSDVEHAQSPLPLHFANAGN